MRIWVVSANAESPLVCTCTESVAKAIQADDFYSVDLPGCMAGEERNINRGATNTIAALQTPPLRFHILRAGDKVWVSWSADGEGERTAVLKAFLDEDSCRKFAAQKMCNVSKLTITWKP